MFNSIPLPKDNVYRFKSIHRKWLLLTCCTKFSSICMIMGINIHTKYDILQYCYYIYLPLTMNFKHLIYKICFGLLCEHDFYFKSLIICSICLENHSNSWFLLTVKAKECIAKNVKIQLSKPSHVLHWLICLSVCHCEIMLLIKTFNEEDPICERLLRCSDYMAVSLPIGTAFLTNSGHMKLRNAKITELM